MRKGRKGRARFGRKDDERGRAEEWCQRKGARTIPMILLVCPLLCCCCMAKVTLIPRNEYDRRVSYPSQPANFGLSLPQHSAVEANLFLPPNGFHDPFLCDSIPSLRRMLGDENNSEDGAENRRRASTHLRRREDHRLLKEEKNEITVVGWEDVPGGNNDTEQDEGLSPSGSASPIHSNVPAARPIALLVKRGECPFAQKAKEALALNRYFQQQQQQQPHPQNTTTSLPQIMYLIVYDDKDDGTDRLFIMDGPRDQLIDLALLFITNRHGIQIIHHIIDIYNATNTTPLLSLTDYDPLTVPNGGWYMPLELDGTTPPKKPRHGNKHRDTNHPDHDTDHSNSSGYHAADTFAWVRLVLVILLIITPCLRWGFLWCSAGGRLTFRRQNGRTGPIVGLRVVHPTGPWLRTPWDAATNHVDDDHDHSGKLTQEQVFALPEILFRPQQHTHEDADKHLSTTKSHHSSTNNSTDNDDHHDSDHDDDHDSDHDDDHDDDPKTKTIPPLPTATITTTTKHTGLNSSNNTYTVSEDAIESPNLTTSSTMCSICIEDFEPGERIRILPRCKHAFHTDCILPWLTERRGCCPLCKLGVMDETMDECDHDNDTNHATINQEENQQQTPPNHVGVEATHGDNQSQSAEGESTSHGNENRFIINPAPILSGDIEQQPHPSTNLED